MLTRTLVIAILLWCAPQIIYAQLTPDPSDRISHYIGLQINPLLRQIISFGNSPDVNNPFLVKYSLRFNETRREIMFGFGYKYSESTTKGGLKSDLSNLSFRAGYSKKIPIGRRLEVGIGADGVFNATNNQTVNVQAINFGAGSMDSTITTSKSTAIGYGLGPQATLSFYITEKILIGTEASYYFIRSKQKLNVQSKNYSIPFPGSPEIVTVNTENDENKSLDFKLQLPVALFLIVVF